MDFGKALTYQFKDTEGIKKILLVSLLSVIPVIGWIIAFGWSLTITRHVIEDDPQPLPEIDIAGDLVRGLQGFVIGLVYNIPALVVAAPLSAIFIFSSFAFTDGRVFGTFWVLTILCIVPVAVLYSITMWMFTAAAYANFLAQGESLVAGFKLSQVFGLLKKAPVAYFLVLIGQFICSFIAFFGLVGCIIGVVFTTAYSWSVMGHLYGQAYKEAIRQK
jgi:hypothetical protein